MDASDFIEKTRKLYQSCVSAWSDVYDKARQDLHFLSDEDGCQWDERDWNDRTSVGRPAAQIDQLTQFCHQVVNDIRMNTPTISIIPADMEADPDTAEMLEGRIKAIEYKSNADCAYDTAVDFSVKSSIGFIRIDRQYIDDDSFDQEMCIKRVVNPLGHFIDHNSTEADGSDAKFAFILDEMPLDTFKERWGDKTPVSFDKSQNEDTQGKEEYVTVVEYFKIEENEEDTGVLEDGTREKVQKGKKYKNTRKMKKREVKHYILSGEDILEETTFPGKYIPLVPVYGEEYWKDGKRGVYSLIRKAKGAQRMFNLWKSLETEMLLKQPQAPVMAAEGQMSGYESAWEQPDKAMVLYYKQTDVDGNQAPAPQRLHPPTIPTGVVNAARGTVEDIKATIGMYNASLGQRSNETSGVAIDARKAEGEVATYHFGDNLVKSVTQVGKIIVSALATIEDSERIVSVVDKEDNFKLVGINGAMTKDQEKSYSYKGKWDVRVTTGAPFTTQRQEAAALYNQTIQAMPDLMPVIGDLVFKYQDAPGSQAIAARLKKLVDPKLLEDEQGEENAQVMQLQAQLQEVTAQAQQQLQMMQAELQDKNVDSQIKQQELGIKAQDSQMRAQNDAAKLEIERMKLQLEAQKMEIEAGKIVMGEGGDTMGQSIEELQAIIEAKMAAQQRREQEMLLVQQQEQARLMQEQMAREQEAQLRLQTTQAIIDSLAGIQNQLGALNSSVQQPITLEYDAAGNLIGAK
jgi:hypothetical protein